MSTIRDDYEDLPAILREATGMAERFHDTLADRPVQARDRSFATGRPIPETGEGAEAAIAELEKTLFPKLSGSVGPRFFGFVTGGATPAAIAGDWLAAAVDQNGADPGDSAACGLAYEALDWLKDLLQLPRVRFDGAFTSGATQANLMGLLSGLHSKARELGYDVGACGLQALPPIRIYGGSPHSSIMHALTALGIGRDAHVRIDCLPNSEAVDPDALAQVLEAEGDTPAIRIVTASVATVTGTDFDDLDRLADIATAHNAWLHADGAFGAFVRCVPELADYAKGLERADSICADGHKWLNVPYDCGFYFTRDIRSVESAWGPLPPYLDIGKTTPIFMNRLVENSQRVRGFPAWATLRAGQLPPCPYPRRLGGGGAGVRTAASGKAERRMLSRSAAGRG